MKGLTITEENLDSLRKERNWKGNGTKNDPIIISDLGVMYSKLKFNDTSRYIHLKNCKPRFLILHNCCNTLVSDSTIRNLRISRSRNIKFINNTIQRVRLLYSGGLVFKKNNLDQSNYSYLKEYDTLKQFLYMVLAPTAVMFMFYVFIFLFFNVFSGINWLPGYYIFFITLTLLAMTYIYLILTRWKTKRAIPSNELINNIVISDEEMSGPIWQKRKIKG